jgi:hypothetical protein
VRLVANHVLHESQKCVLRDIGGIAYDHSQGTLFQRKSLKALLVDQKTPIEKVFLLQIPPGPTECGGFRLDGKTLRIRTSLEESDGNGPAACAPVKEGTFRPKGEGPFDKQLRFGARDETAGAYGQVEAKKGGAADDVGQRFMTDPPFQGLVEIGPLRLIDGPLRMGEKGRSIDSENPAEQEIGLEERSGDTCPGQLVGDMSPQGTEPEHPYPSRLFSLSASSAVRRASMSSKRSPSRIASSL